MFLRHISHKIPTSWILELWNVAFAFHMSFLKENDIYFEKDLHFWKWPTLITLLEFTWNVFTSFQLCNTLKACSKLLDMGETTESDMKHWPDVSSLHYIWSCLNPPEWFYHQLWTNLRWNLFKRDFHIPCLHDSSLLYHILWKVIV